jgi:hypothetical protein
LFGQSGIKQKTHNTCYWAQQGLNYNFKENFNQKTYSDEHTWHKYKHANWPMLSNQHYHENTNH